MVDKIWYDWQNKSPKNKYAYGGGSVEATANYATFSEFQTGIPPNLGVSARSDLKRAPRDNDVGCGFFCFFSSTVRSPETVCGMGFRFGT